MRSFERLAGPDSGLLLIADHSSAAVPPWVDLGMPPEAMSTHIAVDIGIDALARAIAYRLRCPAHLARWSRLVCDVNREADAPGLIPQVSDGVPVPGNQGLTEAGRAARVAIHSDYHAALARSVVLDRPQLLVSLHSFTPRLGSRPAEARPWPVGILWNQDDRGARAAIAALEGDGLLVGANLPYSGQVLNYTMNRHAEANGIAYIGIEVRQDQIADAAGIADWADRLSVVVRSVRETLG